MEISYVRLRGEKYPVCFSLAAASKIEKRFGGLAQMEKALGSSDPAQVIRSAEAVLSVMLDAGRAYARLRCDAVKEPPQLTVQLCVMAIPDLLRAIKRDTKREVLAQPPKRKGKGQAIHEGDAWMYYIGMQAGLTFQEIQSLPMGAVNDLIACYQISHCGAKEKKPSTGSLFEQMKRVRR